MSDSLLVKRSQLLATKTASSKGNEQFLRFHLAPDTTVLLSMTQLTEVLTIPNGQIVPIFHMPSWVMGVYNWRGEILWMVDLGHLVGLTPWHQQVSNASVYRAVVIQAPSPNNVKGEMLGVIVNRVEDTEWCNPDWIQPPSASTVSSELVPFLRGYWLKPNGDMLVVMDSQALIGAMPK